MADMSTPRITSQYIESFVNRNVRITGKVTQLRGTLAVIDSEGPVNLILSHDSHLTPGNAVEIVGKVNQDLTVKLLKATDFGLNFDYNAANAVVDATHRYKDMFYAD